MKIHYILSLAAAGLLLASCSKENIETSETGDDEGRASFTAAVEGSGATRTELGAMDGESYPTLWLRGDRIAVTDGTNTGIYATQDDKTQTAAFTYASGAEVAAGAAVYAACYPAAGYSSCSAGVFSVNLPKTQTYKAGNIDNGAYPMVAVASDTNLRFRNACGIVRLRLSTSEADLKVESIILKAQTSLSGAAEIAYDGAGDPVLSCHGSKSLKLACASGVALGSDPVDFHIVLPPNAAGYEGLEITVNLSDDRFRTFTANTPIKVERSKITTISLEVVNPSGKALLQSGRDFAAAVKTIASGSDKAYDATDVLVKVIEFVTGSAEPKQEGEVEIHDASSAEPVYVSWDAGTQTVIVRTPAEAISLNTNASFMFYNLRSLHTLDLSSFDTSNVKQMGQMFELCNALSSLDLSGFDTSNLACDLFRMFFGCNVLSSLDLSGFDTSNVTGMAQMFANCNAFTTLNLGRGFVMDKVRDKSGMFVNTITSGDCTITCIEATKSAISDESTELDTTKVTWDLLD